MQIKFLTQILLYTKALKWLWFKPQGDTKKIVYFISPILQIRNLARWTWRFVQRHTVNSRKDPQIQPRIYPPLECCFYAPILWESPFAPWYCHFKSVCSPLHAYLREKLHSFHKIINWDLASFSLHLQRLSTRGWFLLPNLSLNTLPTENSPEPSIPPASLSASNQ